MKKRTEHNSVTDKYIYLCTRFYKPSSIFITLKGNLPTTEMDRNDLRSQSLDLLRFPLAVAVVFIHVWTPEVYGPMGDVSMYSFINGLIEGLVRGQSVPIYFFISGYVFFLNIDMSPRTYIRKLRNRSKSLFIPYIVWNSAEIAKTLLFMLPGLAFLSDKTVTLAGTHLSASSLAYSYWDASRGLFGNAPTGGDIFPENYPLWFLRDLMIVVLCTPLIHIAIKKAHAYAMTALGIAWLLCVFHPFGHHGQLLTAFFFFSWGAYMSINKKDMLLIFGKMFKTSAALYACLAVAYAIAYMYYPKATTPLKMLNQCAGLIFAYDLSAWLLRKKTCKVNKFLSSASFFVYVTHILVFGQIFRLLCMLLPQSFSDTYLVFITEMLTLAATVCLLLAVFYLMHRFTPRLLKVVAGRK